MNGILADSSVWIDFFNAKVTNPQKDMLLRLLSKKARLWICPPVFQEVLQGTREGNPLEITRRHLLQCRRGRVGIYHAAEYGAKIYRILRTKGLTIRKPNDCLIAAYAVLNDLVVLHHDRDFDTIEEHFGLKVVH
jgi:predicted nucleic acid-binding protein